MFSAVEKLHTFMLCDLAKPRDERELDFDFIAECVRFGDYWAIDQRYSGMQLGFEVPAEVRRVGHILEMWTVIEGSYAKLSAEEKKRVTEHDGVLGKPRFRGFDGNNEDECHIAGVLIGDPDKWSNFKGRSLNAHMPTMDSHRRLLRRFDPMWKRMTANGGPYDLSADELIEVMREQIHPENRVVAADGTWTVKPRA